MIYMCDGTRDFITFPMRFPGLRLKMITLFSLWLVVLWCAVFCAQEDSLRSALSAVDKRQRYLNRFADDALAAYDGNLEYLGSGGKGVRFFGCILYWFSVL